MNPINEEISDKDFQTSPVLEAKNKIETNSEDLINSEIKNKEESIKDMDTANKSEESNCVEQSKDLNLAEKTKSDENVNETIEKSNEITTEENSEHSTNSKEITEDIEKKEEKIEDTAQKKQSNNDTEIVDSKDTKKIEDDIKVCNKNEILDKGTDDSTKKDKIDKNTEKETDEDIKEKSKQGEADKVVIENSKLSTKETSKQRETDEVVFENSNESAKDDAKSEEDAEETVIDKSNLSDDEDETPDNTNKKEDSEIDNNESDIEEEYEDVEIPEDEEIEELIVPDEADAEDLTSLNGDDPDTSLNENEKTKNSEAEDPDENEEETTKSNDETPINDVSKLTNKVNDSLNEDEEDFGKDAEEEEVDNLAIEPELVAIEEAANEKAAITEDTTNDDDNEDATNNTTNDPLNCTDNLEQDDECEENKSPLGNKSTADDDDDVENEDNDDVENEDNDDVENEDNDDVENEDNENKDAEEEDDDDDEVQFVETRNSPICIESDDEDDTGLQNTSVTTNINKQTITTPTATVTVPKNIIVTRTSARKSTAKPQQVAAAKAVPEIQSKQKSFRYLEKATNYTRSKASSAQPVVDCIELLDSSDEESASHYRPSSQQKRTPQKRTLLAAKGSYNRNPSKNIPTSGRLPNNFAQQIRKQAKKPAPPPLPPATPQSNFLNAVQLQPAAVTGANPPAFSALLSNKSVIIPNAFYGNPPNVDMELERRYARWLENYLAQFCNPQYVATHSSFVFLQRALKYKDFVRIKAIRSNLNTHAKNAREQLNNSLMVDMRTLLLKNNREVTTHGRRFCELTCNSAIAGKAVTLMAHGVTGKVTMKTCNMDMPKANNAASSSSASSSSGANSLTRKRQLEEDEDEYMPDKQKLKTIVCKPPSENGDSEEDRKRSLRTKRSKRLDNSFSYNEDDLLAEFEIDDEEEEEKQAQAEIQRKIDKKRLEAQKQREKQVKSFESAFIQAFAKNIDGNTSSSSKNASSSQRLRPRNSTTASVSSFQEYTSNDSESMLQATWVDNDDDDDAQIISDDDEPKVHRIYKKQQQQYQQQLQLQHQQQQQQQQMQQQNRNIANKTIKSVKYAKAGRPRKNPIAGGEETITGDDDYIENDFNPLDVASCYWPKNVDPQMHVNGKSKDKCVICNLNCQRIVHHYVNEHRGCEIYNSRLTSTQIHVLRRGNCSDSSMSVYKNGQPQYEAYCIFCQKQSRFMLPYWYQHFTMHTGEYAYRCSGCGIRKPTRSLLTQHQSQGCPKKGSVIQDYSHDPKSTKVEARVCTLCNYVQLHRTNIVKHLHQQHNIRQILPKHIQTIVLLKTPSAPSSPTSSPMDSSVKRLRRQAPVSYNQASSSSSSPSTYVIDDDDEEFVIDQEEPSGQSSEDTQQNHYYNYIPPYMQAGNAAANFTWEDDNNGGEDLSFMICGMLDVQMNPE